jgi:spermidine/putrescine transport system substrate-binding protein
MSGGLTRRDLLGLAALGTGAALLASCGDPKDERVSFLNWQDYVDPALLSDFTKASKLEVGYETYESNDELADRLTLAGVRRRGGRKSTSFDLVVPSDNLFRRLRDQDRLQPFDSKIVTDDLLGNLGDAFRTLDADPGNRFGVPWATGTTGIGYDTSVFAEPPSWDVFLDSAYAGKMSLLDESREAFAAALYSLGEDPNTVDAAAVKAAEDQLGKMKANAAFNSGTYLNDLANGTLVVAQAFSTDVLQAKQRNPKLAYTVPESGGTRWVDLLCIPDDAPNPRGANEFVAYYLDPKVSALNAVSVQADTGNDAARQFLPEAMRDDPAIYPPADEAERLTFLRELGEQESLYAEAWERLRG